MTPRDTRPASPLRDNLAEYSGPVLYDLENVPFEPEGPFLLDLA